MGKKQKKHWIFSGRPYQTSYFKETSEGGLEGDVYVAMMEGRSLRMAGPFPAEKAEEFLERAWEVGFDKAYREFGGQ